MPDAQDEGLLTGLCPYGLLLGTLRGHSGTASACNFTKEILTATTQAESKKSSEPSRRVQTNYQCKRRQPIGVKNHFAQGYRANCKPPIAARAAAAAAGVEGRRTNSVLSKLQKLQSTASSRPPLHLPTKSPEAQLGMKHAKCPS